MHAEKYIISLCKILGKLLRSFNSSLRFSSRPIKKSEHSLWFCSAWQAAFLFVFVFSARYALDEVFDFNVIVVYDPESRIRSGMTYGQFRMIFDWCGMTKRDAYLSKIIGL